MKGEGGNIDPKILIYSQSDPLLFKHNLPSKAFITSNTNAQIHVNNNKKVPFDIPWFMTINNWLDYDIQLHFKRPMYSSLT